MEKKQPVDILKSTEMMVYLTARQAVAEDAALKELLSSYQTKAAKKETSLPKKLLHLVQIRNVCMLSSWRIKNFAP